MSFISPLIPLFVNKLSLTLAQVGLLAGFSGLLASIIQPLFGYIADHYKPRAFILGGSLLAVLFMPLMGTVNSFVYLFSVVCLGSIGSAMFHSPSAGMVSMYAGSHSSLCMSIFNSGGTIAFGIGPIFVTYFVYLYGLEALPFTMIIGLVLFPILYTTIPLPEGERLSNLGFLGSMQEALGDVWKSILLIWLLMVLRSFVIQSFLTFLPVFYSNEGYSLVSIGKILSIFAVAGALGGLLTGYLSDIMGYKALFFASNSLATPSLFLLFFLKGNWVYVGSFFAGLFIVSTLPLGVSMAQELVPRGRSMASSLMMGLASGIGGMMTPLTGMAADCFPMLSVFYFLALVPLLSAGLIAWLPETKRQHWL